MASARRVVNAMPAATAARRYAVVEVARRGSRLALVAFPDVSVAVDDLLP